MLRDDPNESSAVYLLTSDNKHAVCETDFLPMQINFFAENVSDDSSLCDFRSHADKGKDQVSPKFISEHHRNCRKAIVCRFCSLITQIIFFRNFLFPKVC